MVAESSFPSLWKIPQRYEGGSERVRIGVLAFEVAGLMSKLVHLWRCLSDKQVSRWRDDIPTCVGLRSLFLKIDEYYNGQLICAEMAETITHVVKSVARLATKCNDSDSKSFELVFAELVQTSADPYKYTIRLTARSIFTVFGRIEHVFGIEQNVDDGDSRVTNSDSITRSLSVSALMQASVHPTNNTGLNQIFFRSVGNV